MDRLASISGLAELHLSSVNVMQIEASAQMARRSSRPSSGSSAINVDRHLGLDVVELATQELDGGFDACACYRPGQAHALALGEQHRRQLSAPRHQRGQVLLGRLWQRTAEPIGVGPTRQQHSELSQHLRILPN